MNRVADEAKVDDVKGAECTPDGASLLQPAGGTNDPGGGKGDDFECVELLRQLGVKRKQWELFTQKAWMEKTETKEIIENYSPDKKSSCYKFVVGLISRISCQGRYDSDFGDLHPDLQDMYDKECSKITKDYNDAKETHDEFMEKRALTCYEVLGRYFLCYHCELIMCLSSLRLNFAILN